MLGVLRSSIVYLTLLTYLAACGQYRGRGDSSLQGGDSGSGFQNPGGGFSLDDFPEPPKPPANIPSDPAQLPNHEDTVQDVFGDAAGEDLVDAISALNSPNSDQNPNATMQQLALAFSILARTNDAQVQAALGRLAQWMSEEIKKINQEKKPGAVEAFFRTVAGLLTQIVQAVIAKFLR